MSDEPCCAHLRIVYDREVVDGENIRGEVVPNGAVRDRWRCSDCGTEFAAVATLRATLRASLAERDADLAAARGEVAQLLAEADGNQSMLTQAIREGAAARERCEKLAAALLTTLCNCGAGENAPGEHRSDCAGMCRLAALGLAGTEGA